MKSHGLQVMEQGFEPTSEFMAHAFSAALPQSQFVKFVVWVWKLEAQDNDW